MVVHLLLSLGIMFLASQAGGRLARFARLPRITGYLVVGVILGPQILGVFSRSLVEEDLLLVTQIALAVIAFSIGGSLKISRIRRLGRAILWITTLQGFGAFIVVALVAMPLLYFYPHIAEGLQRGRGSAAAAFVLAAVATATAPAAVMAIIHECRARGAVTTVLLGVVALDDALCILAFAVALTVAQILIAGAALSWATLILHPVLEIIIALAVGGAVGALLMFPIRLFHDPGTLLGVVLGAVFLTAGLSLSFGASPLLATMTFGFIAVNLFEQHEEAFLPVESIEEPLFGLFFTLAGAHLDFAVGGIALVLALVLTLARFAGKLSGAYLGALVAGAPREVRHNVGLGLLPTAGVAIGLILEARATLPAHPLWSLLVSTVLASVVINELVAPLFVRMALVRSGEAGESPKRFSRKEVASHAGRS